ncbi:hypothetical protein KGM48_02710 [Patescibacteria group bacterium]|nr:hypothetical protein [Patescibacteria group bacterium]
MRPRLFVSSVFPLLFFFAGLPVAFGQTSVSSASSTTAVPVPPPWWLSGQVGRPEGAVSCFDYYRFGSVSVNAVIKDATVKAGESLPVSGAIVNNNSYPIVDGQLYVKIFKKDSRSDASIRLNGYPVVDFFLAKDNVSIASKGSTDLSFSWKAPEGASGNYYMAFYFTSDYRFNLLGLSFTDDVTGNKDDFRVIGSANSSAPVAFDKDAITLNGKSFNPVTFLPHFSQTDPVSLGVTLVNPTDASKTVSVSYVTSKWDGLLDENRVKTDTVNVTLAPKERKKLSYAIPTVATSVTYTTATVTDGDAKSIIFTRFVRDSFPDIRLNFPAVTGYPLMSGTPVTLFSCVHAESMPVVNDNTLTLTLKDENGNTLHTYTYTGDVTGDMMGVKDSYTPAKDLTSFSLTASLAHAGARVEEVTVKYACTDIDPATCPGSSPGGLFQLSLTSPTTASIFILVILLVGISVLFFIRSRRKPKNSPFTIPNE